MLVIYSLSALNFVFVLVVVVAAHLQQEAQGQSGRETEQTQVQPVQQAAAQLADGMIKGPSLYFSTIKKINKLVILEFQELFFCLHKIITCS